MSTLGYILQRLVSAPLFMCLYMFTMIGSTIVGGFLLFHFRGRVAFILWLVFYVPAFLAVSLALAWLAAKLGVGGLQPKGKGFGWLIGRGNTRGWEDGDEEKRRGKLGM